MDGVKEFGNETLTSVSFTRTRHVARLPDAVSALRPRNAVWALLEGELFHHCADDFPAYLVIAALGHVIVPAILVVETAYAPALWLQLLIWLPVTTLSALALLQPTKGAIVGLQWQLGMHGFDASKRRRPVPGQSRLS